MFSPCHRKAVDATSETDVPALRHGPTLADVLRQGLSNYTASHRLPLHHWKALNAILRCQSGQLGGHLYACTHCGREHFQPHSCRNRHCPTCQGANSQKWLAQQQDSLLPVPYFHIVFTLPHLLNALIQQNQKLLYKLLFDCAAQTLLEFGRNKLDAQIGVTAVLHTWSQTLMDHYHLHCIVTGGGLSEKNWISSHPRYLFAVKALSKVFRGRFCSALQQLYSEGKLQFHGNIHGPGDHFRALLDQATRHQWVVYSKRPITGPTQVLAYLSRYTHRVAISNRRILRFNPKTVTFSYKDYSDGAQRKVMTLADAEFIRRFLLHILPPKFVKIRHYGLLGNHQRKHKLKLARALLAMQTSSPATHTESNSPSEPLCPHCGKAALKLIRIIHPTRFKKVSLLNSS